MISPEELKQRCARAELDIGISRGEADDVLDTFYKAYHMTDAQLRYTDYTIGIVMEFVKQNSGVHLKERVVDGVDVLEYDAQAAGEMNDRAKGAADVAMFLGLTDEEMKVAMNLGERICTFTPKQQLYYLHICTEASSEQNGGIKEEYNGKK